MLTYGLQQHSSDESEDEITSLLRKQGMNKESIRKFKNGRRRIRGRKIIDNSCSECAQVTVGKLRSGFTSSVSFKQLLSSSEACRLCRLVVMSLRNKLPEIDKKLGYEESGDTVRRVAVKFDDDGGTDLDGDDAFNVTTLAGKEGVLEDFRLMMSGGPDGIIRVIAQISEKSTFRNSNQKLLEIKSFLRIYTNNVEINKDVLIPLDPRPKAAHKIDLMRRWLMAEMTWPERFVAPVTLSLGIDRKVSYPTRLIHIPYDFASPQGKLRLINSEELFQYENTVSLKQYPPYITLSHRWGSTHHFTSTKTTLESRRTGFSFNELPKTYRDAVSVAATLGFGYIWIDAICILQDDPADWLAESQKMGTIYRHATCTIASHCAQDDDTGFLEAAFDRRGSTKLSSPHMHGMFLRPAADLELDISKSPLSKRGWILQERFLSTRILHFTVGMIYLETARGIKSEDGDTPMEFARTNLMASDLFTHDQFLHQKPVTLQNFSSCLPQSFRTIEESCDTRNTRLSPTEWFSLLEMYTTCSLTKEQDKLTAISGIAQVCRQTTASSYLAGVWADRLVAGLMWMNVGPPLRKSSVFRASSWNWAAYDGPTQFPLAGDSVSYTTNFCLAPKAIPDNTWCNGPLDLTVLVDFLDLSSDFLSSGLLISLYREALYPPQNKRLGSALYDALWKFHYDPPIRLFDIFNVHRFLWSKGIGFESDTSWIVFDSEDSYREQSKVNTSISCISMAAFEAPNQRYEGLVPVRMVIFVVPTEKPNTYRRIGAGVIRSTFLKNLSILRRYHEHVGDKSWYSSTSLLFGPRFARREITLV